MKKWLFAALLLLLLFTAGSYLLLPAQLNVAAVVPVKASTKAVYRSLYHEAAWRGWWPAQSAAAPATFVYGDTRYTVSQKLFNSFIIQLKRGTDSVNSTLTIIPAGSDSNFLQWSYSQPAGRNPLRKLQHYLQAQNQKKDLKFLLQRLQQYLASEENIYGLRISRAKVTDTALVATRFQTPYYPGTDTIYHFVNRLYQYIAAQGATPANAPMLHVRKTSAQQFETMVALPTSRLLPPAERIEPKRMVMGNILVAEVRGGPATVQNALEQLENYVLDKELESPAIPFASLVTDRLKQPDSTQWVTRVYYPIF